MTFKTMSMLVAVVFGISVGQILFKKTADSMSKADSFYVIFFAPSLWIALVIYGTCTLLWIIILRIVPLSVAYSVFSLSFLIVPTLAYLFLNEPVSWRVYAGGVLILSGIFFIARAN